MEIGATSDELFDFVSNKVLIGSLARNISIKAKSITVVPKKHFSTEVFQFTAIRRSFLKDLMIMNVT